MSTTETPGALAPAPLTDQQKQLSAAILGNPLEYPDGFNAYLEQFILLRIPTNPAFQVLAQKMAYPVGFPRLVMEDLTANTSEYVWTDPVTGLGYLYCNGAAVSQTTYADLYAQWGASKWAADSGGNFSLPDTRGRGLLLAGTHADVDLGDTFGPATESSRRGTKHGHAITSLTVTGAPGLGTLAISGAPDAGTLAVTVPIGNNSGGGTAVKDDNATITRNQSGTVSGAPGKGSLAVSGTPSAGTLDVGGTIGSDTNEGGAAIVIGSLVVRY